MTTCKRPLVLLVLAWVPAPAAHARPQAAAPAPQVGALEIGDPYFPGLGNGGYDVEHYALELRVDMKANAIAATARIRARALHDLAGFSFDLYGLRVERVSVDGKEALFERPSPAPRAGGTSDQPAELVIHPAKPLAAGAVFLA